ncbi:class I SAM-dependent methyltransferase [Algoriphagus namhaensis]
MEKKEYVHKEHIHNISAAEIILPIVFHFIQAQSIIDIGCGIGTWLNVSKSLGVNEVQGVDGDYVDRKLLKKHLRLDYFLASDLSLPLVLDRRFDLALCLEVAEHLPESSSHVLVSSLVKHSDVILFSAAIPGQGGQNHINEQWPDYWAQLFKEHDYVFLDIIRPLIWDNPNVDFWYRQNIFLVVKNTHKLALKYSSSHLSLVHPELFDRINQHKDNQINLLKEQLAINPLKRLIASILKK